MLGLLFIWAALLAALVIFAVRSQAKGGALTLAYFVGLSLIHVPGVLVFLDGGTLLPNGEETLRGFEMTLIGMAAFVFGAVIAARRHKPATGTEVLFTSSRIQAFESIGWRLMGIGALAYFVLVPLSFAVSSLTSPIAALGTLLVIGIWLRLYASVVANDQPKMLATLALVPLLPFATVVSGGFMSYGTYWALSAVAFLFVIVRKRVWFYVAALPVVYLGLSLFVTYMGERVAIRQVVQQQATFAERLSRVSPIITNLQLFDLNEPAHSKALNERLNQNWIVGAGIFRHEDGLTEFAHGGTLPWWAPIPRAIWPDKPIVGGGGDIVADYTGIDFGTDTSVGVGQVLEFYINFGLPGVIIGFAGFGYLLMWLDYGIAAAFSRGDLSGLLIRAMPGLNLLQPGGNLLEIVVGTITALLVAYLLYYFRAFRVPLPPSAIVRASARVTPDSGKIVRP